MTEKLCYWTVNGRLCQYKWACSIFGKNSVFTILRSFKLKIRYDQLCSWTQPELSKGTIPVVYVSCPGVLEGIAKLFFGRWLSFVLFSFKIIPDCVVFGIFHRFHQINEQWIIHWWLIGQCAKKLWTSETWENVVHF